MIKTSTGVQNLRRRIAIKAKADVHHRFWGMFCHVWKHDVLEAAYRLAKSNKGAAGSDGKTFSDIELEGVQNLIEELSRELKEGKYRPLPLRIVEIPKANGIRRIKIAAIRDRVVQGALKLILEPIFEMDFQEGSYGYRPKRTAHQALARVRDGIYKNLRDVIDLDLKSYFDTVQHSLLLSKISKRINDPQIMKLCKIILKSGGKQGLPQGSLIGPVFSNLFLNDIDKMLEKAQQVTKRGKYETIRYVRFADDILVLVNSFDSTRKNHWVEKVIHRLREELGNLKLQVNEEKTKVVHLDKGDTLDYLGFTFRLTKPNKPKDKRKVILRPMRKKRTEFLRKVSLQMKRNFFKPVDQMVKENLNPMIRGWVNYFRCGNSAYDLNFVKWQIETKVRKFATRQSKSNKNGRSWSKWSYQEIYGKWGLYSNYRVSYSSLG